MRKLVFLALLSAYIALPGCTGAQAAAGTEMTCEIVRKICSVAGAACAIAPAIAESTSGGEAEAAP